MRQQLCVFQELRKECTFLESQQQYEKAISNLERILVLDPENSLAYYHKGVIYFQQDEYEKAIGFFELALKYDESNCSIMQNIGLTYKTMKQFEKALKYFNLCLNSDSKNNEAAWLKGDTLREMGEFVQSELILQEVFQRDSQNLQVIQSLLDLKLDQQKFEETQHLVLLILSLKDADLEILETIAFRLSSLKQQQQALSILDKIISKDHNNIEVHYSKGVILYNQDKFTEALASFEKVVALDEMHTSALLYLALSFGQLNRMKETVNIFGKLLNINPKDATVWNNKGIAFREMKMYQQALNCFNEALNINPKNPLYKVNKASILLETNRDEGILLLQEAKVEFSEQEQNQNAGFTSVNIQYMQDQFQILSINEQQEEQENEQINDDSFIPPKRKDRQKTEELKSEIFQYGDQKKEISFIQQSCMIQFSNEISAVENSIVGAQIANKGKKNSKFKYEQLSLMYQQLEQKIIDIENKIKIVGIDKRAEIYSQLESFKKTIEGMNQLNYYRAFFWTVFNYFQSYALQTSGLFLYSTNQTIQTKGEQIVDKIETALNIGVKLSAPLPAINSVVSAIHSAVKTLFSLHKDNKHLDRVEMIQTLISNKTINMQDLELQISIAALDLAKKKIDQLKDQQQITLTQTKTFATEVKNIMSRMIDSQSSLYQGGAAQIGLEDALNCLGYFYQNGLLDQDEELSQQLVNIIILKRYIILKTEVIDDSKSCYSCICNIF